MLKDAVRITNYNTALVPVILAPVVLVLYLSFIALLIFNLADAKDLSLVERILGLVIGASICAYSSYKAFAGCLWIEFGESVRVRTLRGIQSYAWDDIADWGFATETSRVRGIPIGEHLMFVVVFKSGQTYPVKVSREEAKSLEEGLSQASDVELPQDIEG